MPRTIKQFHGKDRARFANVNKYLVALKNRNAKIPTAGILDVDDLTACNRLIAKMNTLLAATVDV